MRNSSKCSQILFYFDYYYNCYPYSYTSYYTAFFLDHFDKTFTIFKLQSSPLNYLQNNYYYQSLFYFVIVVVYTYHLIP